MTNRHNAALAVSAAARVKQVPVAGPAGYYPSRKFPGMSFRKRGSCDLVAFDTPPVPLNEITTEPFAAEGRRLAVEDRMRRNRAGYFKWRQSIGDAYYDEQDRLAGRAAANDNRKSRRVAV